MTPSTVSRCLSSFLYEKGRPAYEHYLHLSWVEVRSGRQRLHTAKLLKRVAFLAKGFPQTGEEGEANGLHGWSRAHTVHNDCVSIVFDHVESPFYWSGPGKDWRLQPGLFNSEVPSGIAVEHAGTVAMAEFLNSSPTLSADFPSCPAAAALG